VSVGTSIVARKILFQDGTLAVRHGAGDNKEIRFTIELAHVYVKYNKDAVGIRRLQLALVMTTITI
jgi:hypothetical protein